MRPRHTGLVEGERSPEPLRPLAAAVEAEEHLAVSSAHLDDYDYDPLGIGGADPGYPRPQDWQARRSTAWLWIPGLSVLLLVAYIAWVVR